MARLTMVLSSQLVQFMTILQGKVSFSRNKLCSSQTIGTMNSFYKFDILNLQLFVIYYTTLRA